MGGKIFGSVPQKDTGFATEYMHFESTGQHICMCE